MRRYNEKEKIRDHYDRVSPYYIALWGEHLHHGYWVRGDESKEEAQLQLVEHLAQCAGVRKQCTVLDIGCGFGGSSLHLAKKYGASATGITISAAQVEMANAAAKKAGVSAKFLVMDAEAMKFKEPFDVLWSIESISHYQDHEKFFASAAGLLKAGGILAITDWFKKDGLTAREHQRALEPIEKGMLVELRTMEKYEKLMRANGLQVVKTESLNRQCAKTWDLCLDLIKKKELWAIAAQNGVAFVHYLKAFKAMRAGFASGKFVYGLIVATKPAAGSRGGLS
ncbi:MAG TPA: class I SAM-dependent methyltransferase [Candidatus Acidoferrum sp.]|nr:class I SAM-dependent methyltransferase [Candidatus Acidoferrum sp.]